MAENNIIGIELSSLRQLIKEVVQEEITLKADQIIAALRPNKLELREGEQYTTNMVAELLGVTRHTIRNYTLEGILDEPATNLSGRPYWTAEQIRSAGRKKGIETKFQV
jgi:hypothetical protein